MEQIKFCSQAPRDYGTKFLKLMNQTLKIDIKEYLIFHYFIVN